MADDLIVNQVSGATNNTQMVSSGQLKIPARNFSAYELYKWEEPNFVDLQERYNYLTLRTNVLWETFTNVGEIAFINPSTFAFYEIKKSWATNEQGKQLGNFLLRRVKPEIKDVSEKIFNEKLSYYEKILGSDKNFTVTNPDNPQESINLVLAYEKIYNKFKSLLSKLPSDSPVFQKIKLANYSDSEFIGQDALINLTAVLCRMAEKYAMVANQQNQVIYGSGEKNFEKAVQLFYYLSGIDFSETELAKNKCILPDATIEFYGKKYLELINPQVQATRNAIDKVRIWMETINTLLEDRAYLTNSLPYNWNIFRRKEREECLKKLEENNSKIKIAYNEFQKAVDNFKNVLDRPLGNSLIEREKIIGNVFSYLLENNSGIDYSLLRIKAQLGGALKSLAEEYQRKGEILKSDDFGKSKQFLNKANFCWAEAEKFLDEALRPENLPETRGQYFDYVPMAYLDWAEVKIFKAQQLAKSGEQEKLIEANQIAEKIWAVFNKNFTLNKPDIFYDYANPAFNKGGALADNVLARILSQRVNPRLDRGYVLASSIMRFFRVLLRAGKLIGDLKLTQNPDNYRVLEDYGNALGAFVFGTWRDGRERMVKIISGFVEGLDENQKAVFKEALEEKLTFPARLDPPTGIASIRDIVFYDVVDLAPPLKKPEELKPLVIEMRVSENLAEVLKKASQHHLFQRADGTSKIAVEELKNVLPTSEKLRAVPKLLEYIKNNPEKYSYDERKKEITALVNLSKKDRDNLLNCFQAEGALRDEDLKAVNRLTGRQKSLRITISSDLTWQEFILLLGAEFTQRNREFLYPRGTGTYTAGTKSGYTSNFEEEVWRASDGQFWCQVFDYLDGINPLSRLGTKPLEQVLNLEKQLEKLKKAKTPEEKDQIQQEITSLLEVEDGKIQHPFLEIVKEYDIDLSKFKDPYDVWDTLERFVSAFRPGVAFGLNVKVIDNPENAYQKKLRLIAHSPIVDLQLVDAFKYFMEKLGLKDEGEKFLQEVSNESTRRHKELGGDQFYIFGYAVDYLWHKLPFSQFSPEQLAEVHKRNENVRFYADFSILGMDLEQIPSHPSEVTLSEEEKKDEQRSISQKGEEALKKISFLKNQVNEFESKWEKFLNQGSQYFSQKKHDDFMRLKTWLELKIFTVVKNFEIADDHKKMQQLFSNKSPYQSRILGEIKPPEAELLEDSERPLDKELYKILYQINYTLSNPNITQDEFSKLQRELALNLSTLEEADELRKRLSSLKGQLSTKEFNDLVKHYQNKFSSLRTIFVVDKKETPFLDIMGEGVLKQ